MRISIRKSKNFEFIYIIKDIYSNGSRTTKTVEKLDKINELCSEKNLSRDQVIECAKSRAKKLTADEKNKNSNIIIPFSSNCIIDLDAERKFNCGYLFLQSIYYQLKLDNGFYAITTNLEDDDVKSIIAVSERRWQIEECFRIMKTDFKARPVYVQKEDSIEAHFLTCFI